MIERGMMPREYNMCVRAWCACARVRVRVCVCVCMGMPLCAGEPVPVCPCGGMCRCTYHPTRIPISHPILTVIYTLLLATH